MDEQEFERGPLPEGRDSTMRKRAWGICLAILLCLAFLAAIVWVTLSNMTGAGTSEPEGLTQTSPTGVTYPSRKGTGNAWEAG